VSQSLRRVLQDYSVDALQVMTKFVGLRIVSTEKQAYVNGLADALSKQDNITAALSRLDDLERLILKHMLLQEGTAKTDLLKQELLQSNFISESPSRAYTGSPYRRMPRYFEDIMARLAAFGLVFTFNGDGRGASGPELGLSPGLRLVIPDPIRQLLPSLSTWSKPMSSEQIPVVWETAADEFQRDLFLFWSYVYRHEVALTSRGWLPKRHWSRINREFRVKENASSARSEGETNRLYFLHRLMEEMGLLRRAGSELRTAPDSRDYLGLSLRARTERAFRAWLRISTWNELTRIPELHIDQPRKWDSRLASVVRAGRQFIVGLLRHSAPGQWIPVGELVEQAKAINYDFLFPRSHDAYGMDYPRQSHGSATLSWVQPAYNGTKGWDMLEARFIAHILREPLHWMGVVSLGWAGDRLMAFRISPLGAQILGIVPPQPEPKPKQRIIVQPNFQIFALEPISDYTLSILDEFAERVKSEHAFEYHLTRESVYQAQQRGMTASEIIAFLDRESATPLPQNIELTLQEWGRYHERIVFFQNVALCQVAEPALLDRLVGDRDIAPLLGRRASPTAALVSGKAHSSPRLKESLQRKGLLPATSRPPTPSTPVLTVGPEGRIRFRLPIPDILLLHKLAPFTERRRGDLYVTKRAVTQALKSGWTATRIIETLRSLQQGPLAPEIVSRIKVWGKHYGKATIKQVTLLQLKSADILRELCADPTVGPLIVPFSMAEALALVRDEDVGMLTRALREKGMELSEQLRHA